MPAADWSISAPKCVAEPVPSEPYESCPGAALAWATMSASVLPGMSLRTTSSSPMSATRPIVVKLRTGSYGSRERMTGLSVSVVLEPRSRVYPSGAALATADAATTVLAPGLFSTTIGCPRCSPIAAASRRPRMSVARPGAEGTPSLIGRSGWVWASAAPGAVSANASAQAKRPDTRRERSIGGGSYLPGRAAGAAARIPAIPPGQQRAGHARMAAGLVVSMADLQQRGIGLRRADDLQAHRQPRIGARPEARRHRQRRQAGHGGGHHDLHPAVVAVHGPPAHNDRPLPPPPH